MNRAVIRAAIVFAVAAQAASAADITIQSSLSQGFSTLDGFGSGDDGDPSLRMTTDLGVLLRMQTPATQMSLNAGIRASGNTDNDGAFYDVNPRVSGSITHSAPRITSFATFSVIPQFRDEADFDTIFAVDPGTGELVEAGRTRTDIQALQISISARAGASLRLDQRNSLSASASVRQLEYDKTTETLQPTRTIGGSLSWSHALNARSNAGLSWGFQHFWSDREDQSDTISTNLSAQYSIQATPRHRLSASAGLSYVDDEGGDVGFTGGLNLGYSPTNDTSMGFGINQGVDQNDFGQVQTVTQARASLSHRINSVSSFNLGSALSADAPIGSGGEDNYSLTLQAQYAHRISDDWRFSIGYGFRIEGEVDSPTDDLSGTNRVFLNFSRNFDLLP